MRQLRKKAELSLTQMHLITGLNPSLLSRLENGKENWTEERKELFKNACRKYKQPLTA